MSIPSGVFLDSKGKSLWLLLIAGVLWTMATSPLMAARAMRPLEMKQSYLEVLGVLATGDLETSLTNLLEFEQAAVGGDQAWRYVDNLWRAKLQVIRDLLGTQSPELLKPIIILHHDAYFRYSEMERSYLAQHSRTMAGELAEIYAERADTPSAKAFAGWILTSFGAYLWSPSNIGGSAELFYQTHLVDPGNEVALQGLAAAWERSGEYEKAIEYLDKALVQQPDNPELNLRKALCNLRFPDGLHDGAMATLSELTKAGHPSWIRSVAYQEKARALLANEDRAAAEAILRDGLKALPGDQQISLQLASILDEDRHRSESIAVLEAIEIMGWEQESARQTYDFWEPPDLDGVRTQAHQDLEDGYALLKTGLAASGGAGP